MTDNLKKSMILMFVLFPFSLRQGVKKIKLRRRKLRRSTPNGRFRKTKAPHIRASR